MLITKNKNTDKLTLKYDHYGKKGYKKDRYWKLHPNLAPNKINKASPVSAQKSDSKEMLVLDILFTLYKD